MQDGQTALCTASKNGHTKIVELLQEAKVGIGCASQITHNSMQFSGVDKYENINLEDDRKFQSNWQKILLTDAASFINTS